MDWVDLKRSVSKETEDALWQFFIDHSRINPDGSWFIGFAVNDIDDFWRRVHARKADLFRRYDNNRKQNTQAVFKAISGTANKWTRINAKALSIPLFKYVWPVLVRWLDGK